MAALTNPKHEEFAHAYVALRYNASAAALAVGMPNYEGKNLLCYEGVARRVRELQRPILKRYEITADRTMMGLARVAFVDPRRMVDEEGNLRPIHALDEDVAGAIKGFKVREEFETHITTEPDLATGEPKPVKKRIRIVTTEVKLNDRVPALTVLAKHFKLVNDEGEGISALAEALSNRLKAARRPRTTIEGAEDARITLSDVQAESALPELSGPVQDAGGR